MISLKLLMHYIIIFFFYCLTINPLYSQTNNGEWEIWILPEKYELSMNETLTIAYGITGYGNTDFENTKFTIYAESETKISMPEAPEFEEKEIFAAIPNTSITDITDYKNKRLNKIYKNRILIAADINGNGIIQVTPKNSGDKKVDFVFTYEKNGNWVTKTKEFHYHVNTWSEDNEMLLNLLNFITIALTILAFSPNNLLSNSLKRVINKVKELITKIRLKIGNRNASKNS